MEFLYQKNNLTLESERKNLQFAPDHVLLDGLMIDMAGEYEKWWFLAYAHEEAENRIYQIRVEGETIGFVPTLRNDLSPEELNFFGDIDILVMPTAKSTIPLLEKIEPRMLITYGETAHELATALGISEPLTAKYKVKEADMSLEKMGVVVMWE